MSLPSDIHALLKLADAGDSEAKANLISALLVLADAGDLEATATLYPLVEPKLRDIARAILRRNAAHELNATELIDDAFVKLVGRGKARNPAVRLMFFNCAAKVMNNFLIDLRRKRMTKIRGEGAAHDPFDDELFSPARKQRSDGLDFSVDLRKPLEELQAIDREAAITFRLKYFLTLSFDETAELLGAKSRSEVVRANGRALAWLRPHLQGYGHEC